MFSTATSPLQPMAAFAWGFNTRSVGQSAKTEPRAARAAKAEPRHSREVQSLIDALRPLSDRQLAVLGLQRESLADDLAEMMSVREGLAVEHAAAEGLYGKLSSRLDACG